MFIPFDHRTISLAMEQALHRHYQWVFFHPMETSGQDLATYEVEFWNSDWAEHKIAYLHFVYCYANRGQLSGLYFNQIDKYIIQNKDGTIHSEPLRDMEKQYHMAANHKQILSALGNQFAASIQRVENLLDTWRP